MLPILGLRNARVARRVTLPEDNPAAGQYMIVTTDASAGHEHLMVDGTVIA